MKNVVEQTEQLEQDGFVTIPKIYNKSEVENIIKFIEANQTEKVFGEREYLIKYPKLVDAIFTPNLREILDDFFTQAYAIIKSIYFDKPPNANWVVNWHQDLTINLDTKSNIIGFPNARKLKERIVLRPNIKVLENIVTVRIHLDDCTQENGALRVIKNSHQNGVIAISDWLLKKTGEEIICEVPAGGCLFMKPLTMHSSRRTENKKNRRVLHVEFCSMPLEKELKWKERIEVL